MGTIFKTKSKSKKLLKVESPWWREDIEREEDLIEEIGRIFGYERIEARMPILPLSFPKSRIPETLTLCVGYNVAWRSENACSPEPQIFQGKQASPSEPRTHQRIRVP